MCADRFTGWKLDVEVSLTVGTLSFALETTSSTVAIVGPSGAGKSTILRVLAGVERRVRGSVTVNGQSWLDSPTGASLPPWERGVGWVPQEASLFPHLTVRDNLAYAGADAAGVEEIAALLEVSDLIDRRPRRLSGGERQRVALGRALLSSPRLLLLDEPFSALDRPLRAKLSRLVREWADEHRVPLVLVSHDEDDARVLADERWHLAGGVLAISPGDRPPARDSPA